ncbi:MAG: S9 family peptidase [Metallosphaera sp.]|uniref:S9 family peptidase n=1 Tax=Metallosphaera sp. TaxID=2020860 RepID=UPI003167079D
MDAREAYSIKVISEIRLERLGLLYGETRIKDNDYVTTVYLKDKPILEGKISLPKFIGDDLYYVKSEGSSALMRQSPYGEPQKVVELGKVLKYEPHGKGLLILGEDPLTKAEKDAPLVTSKRKYRFDGRGLLRTRTSLYLFDNKLRKVIEGDFDVTDFSTNGKRIVVSTSQPDDDVGLNALYELNLDNGEMKRITEKEGSIVALTMNENGEVAMLGHDRGKLPWAIREVILPEEGKRFVCGNTCGSTVLTDIFDGAKERLIFRGDEILTLGQIGGEVNIYRISDGKTEKLTHGQHVVRLFDYDGESLVYSLTRPDKPSLLVRKDEIYDPNPNFKGAIPEKVASSIEGWGIITGDNPTILFIHGGPHTAYGYSFFIEFQFFAQNGFNVIFANPSGSQGYGEDFARRCVGDWGGRDMQELLQFVQDVKKQYNLTKKIGVTGGSYGGFMTNWIVTQTDVFSAAISERSISNLVSMCGTSDIGFWFNAIESGIEDPWTVESMDKLMKMSPIYHVGKVKTPTMLIHGEEDYRCPIEQAEQFYVALRSRGVEAKLVRYQGDGHEHARKGRPENMIHRLSVKLEWFNAHLK